MAREIAPETLRSWLDQRRPVTVLDVRPDDEREQWAIPGSVHLNAYDALRSGEADRLAAFNPPSGQPVITVCAGGRVSQRAADILSSRGIDAYSLAGGMKAWSLAWNTAEVPVRVRARVLQVRRTGKGCLSYVIGSAGEAIVLDPSLPPQLYLDLAAAEGWRIRSVLETHLHADHLSRARMLAEQARASLLLPDQARAHFSFEPVRDGDVITVGSVSLVAHRTPGHTHESTSYVLSGSAVFTGDTLFTKGVGRPDLHTDSAGARERANALLHSLQRLSELGAQILVLPAHASEPVPFDNTPVAATMGEIMRWLPDWISSEAAFNARLLSHLPPVPPNFARIVALNEAGELPGDPIELEAGANRCAVA